MAENRQRLPRRRWVPAGIGYPLMPLGRDGARTPLRHADLALQGRQMRSPDQSLTKRVPHIRHWRCLDDPGTPESRAGLLFCR